MRFGAALCSVPLVHSFGTYSPIIQSDGVMVWAEDMTYDDDLPGALYKFALDGTELWKWSDKSCVAGRTDFLGGYSGDMVYVCCDDSLNGIGRDGHLKWNYTMKGLPKHVDGEGVVYFTDTIWSQLPQVVHAVSPAGELKWVADPLDSIAGFTPTGRMYGWNGTSLHCLDTAGGRKQWHVDLDMTSEIMVAPEGIVYHVENDHLFSFSDDGSMKWKRSCPNISRVDSLDEDGTIYVKFKGRHGLRAFDKEGLEKWALESEEVYPGYDEDWSWTKYSHPSSQTADGQIFLQTSLPPSNLSTCGSGHLEWQVLGVQQNGSSTQLYGTTNSSCYEDVDMGLIMPIVGADGTVFVSNVEGFGGPEVRTLIALDADGSMKWRTHGMDPAPHDWGKVTTVGPPAVAEDGTVYVVQHTVGCAFLHDYCKRSFLALDSSNGARKWEKILFDANTSEIAII